METQTNDTRTNLTKGSLEVIFQIDVYVASGLYDNKVSSHWSMPSETPWNFIARVRSNGVKAGTDLDKCLANLQQRIGDMNEDYCKTLKS